MENLNLKLDVQVASKKSISNWNALFSNRVSKGAKIRNRYNQVPHLEHTLIIYVQYKRFQEKNFISFREIVRERFSTFRFRQHF